jgi:hypothetical protein
VRNVPDIVGIGKRRIHKNAVECSQIAIALQKIGLPCVIDTVNRAETVGHIEIQLNRCDRVAVSITANRINDSARSCGGF